MDIAPQHAPVDDRHIALRRAVLCVGALNLAYFLVEFRVARHIGSVALLADSIDFLEDAAVNGLVLLALGWPQRRRGAVGILLAFILLLPGLATAWTAWQKIVLPVPPPPFPLSLTAVGALAINLLCAFLLTRVRNTGGSLSRAAFLSARNDAAANVAIMAAAVVTVVRVSAWPDLLVGLGLLVLNLTAALEVYRTARREHRMPDAAD